METALEVGTLLAQLLPSLVMLYDKIVANNQNAGLVPSATLLADVIRTSTTMESTAQAQIIAGEAKEG